MTGRLLITLDGETLLDQDHVTEVNGSSSIQGQITLNATCEPRPRPKTRPNTSWLRFSESTRCGFGRDYTVDGDGVYRCQTCDRPLPSKGRHCEAHR